PAGHQLEVLLGEGREEGDLGQVVEERITTQASHVRNLVTVSTRRACMTGAAAGRIDGGLGQAGSRLRLVPELAGADGPPAAPRFRRRAGRSPRRARVPRAFGQEKEAGVGN